MQPAVGAARLRTLADESASTYVKGYDAWRPDWSAIRYWDGSPISFATPVVSEIPELGFGMFANAVVYGQQGLPVVNGGCLPVDAILVHAHQRFRPYSRPMAVDPPTPLAGVTVNLGSVFATTNYGHSLLDGLGRIGVLQAGGFDVTRADHVLVSSFASSTLRTILGLAGVESERIIPLHSRSHYECEMLVQASYPGRSRAYSPAVARFARSLEVGDRSRPSRRLAIFRKGLKRSVENMRELEGLAEECGLELYDPMRAAFPPADFAQAELVVGVHGAAMSDIAFCQPGATVVELMPSGHRYPYFATLSIASDLNYVALDCASLSPERGANVVVDVDSLRTALERVVTSSAGP